MGKERRCEWVRVVCMVLVTLSGAGCSAVQGHRGSIEPVETLALTSLPGRITVESGGLRQVTLTWKVPERDHGALNVLRGETPDGPFNHVARVLVAEGRFVDGGLSDDRAYYYRLALPEDAGSDAQLSAIYKGITAPPPAPVNGFRSVDSLVGVVRLEWWPALEESVESYVLYRSDDNVVFHELAVVEGRDSTEFSDGGKEPGLLPHDVEYWYRLVAVNAVNSTSSPCKAVSARTHPPPPVVEGVVAISGEPRKVLLTWHPSGDSKVDAYEVLRQATGETFNVVGVVRGRKEHSYVDMGNVSALTGFLKHGKGTGSLNDQAAYRYAIIAVNIGGARSEPSAVIQAVTKSPPPAPGKVTVSDGLYGMVVASCAVPAADALARIHIERQAEGDSEWERIASIKYKGQHEVRIEDKKAPANIRLSYRFAVEDDDGIVSAWSEPVTGFRVPKD